MDKSEGHLVLQRELATYREMSYKALSALIGVDRAFEVLGPSTVRYQIEISVVWDAEPEGDLRVMASIDDGGWRAFAPLTASFMAPDGSFVGE